jgi:hypothetical protein
MPVSWVWRHFGWWLVDAAALLGHPSNGLSQGSQRGEVPLVQAVQDAG